MSFRCRRYREMKGINSRDGLAAASARVGRLDKRVAIDQARMHKPCNEAEHNPRDRAKRIHAKQTLALLQ